MAVYGPARPGHDAPLLFDTGADPAQREDLAAEDETTASRLRDLMVRAMEAFDAPDAQFDRLSLAEYR